MGHLVLKEQELMGLRVSGSSRKLIRVGLGQHDDQVLRDRQGDWVLKGHHVYQGRQGRDVHLGR